MTDAKARDSDQGSTSGSRLAVLVVTPKGFMGGAERWLLSVLEHADRLDPTIVMLQDGPLRGALASRGFRTTVLPTGARGSDIAAAAGRLRQIIGSANPDVVLANGIKAATVALAPARLSGVPAVWVRHESSYADSLGQLALRLADSTIVVGPPTDDDVRRGRVDFLPPPVLTEPMPAATARQVVRDLGVPDDRLLRVGIFARLVRYKGIDMMINALAEPGGQDWRLIVAGTPDPGELGDERAYLEGLAREAGVADRVTWLGEVDGAGRLAAAMDAVAVPTRSGVPGYPPGEGFGMTVVEAFAAGVPVLADPSTVPAVQLPGYVDGAVTVDATAPDSIAAGLAQLADQAHRDRLRGRAAEHGAAHPRPADVAEALTAVLARVTFRPGVGLASGPAMTVVTTVRNERGGIETWLRTLTDQLGADDELVVVDGGSEDGTVECLREWSARDPRIKVLVSLGAGISEGRNIGIRAAATEWIACTDAGCVPDPGWLDAFRRAAAAGGVDLVTGVYRAGPRDGKAWELALAAVSYPVPEELRRPSLLDRAYGRLFGRAYDANLPTGRSVAFTKRAWELAGGYPEDLATAEDVLFGKRAVAAGARPLLSVEAAVTWDQRPTLRGNARMFRGYGRGDGQSGDPQLVVRNVIRGGVYTIGPLMFVAAPRLRPLVALAGAAYLSVPLRRALRGPRPIATTALVPAMAAMRDVVKAVGYVEGLVVRRRRQGT